MIIPRTERLALWSGETIEVSLHVSHYGPVDLEGASLVYSLTGESVANSYQTLANVNLPANQVTELTSLQITIPKVDAPVRAHLKLQLQDGAGELVAKSEMPLSLFPRRDAPTQTVTCTDEALGAKLRDAGYNVTTTLSPEIPLITLKMDYATRRFVEQGCKVLFLAEKPEALQVEVPRLQLQARKGTSWAGNWASSFTWYRQDLWAGDVPGDGRFDFTFAPVISETVIKSARTKDYETEVLAGIFVGWLRRAAALVQQIPLGQGKLLVSTLRLQDNITSNPLASSLFQSLLAQLGNS